MQDIEYSWYFYLPTSFKKWLCSYLRVADQYGENGIYLFKFSYIIKCFFYRLFFNSFVPPRIKSQNWCCSCGVKIGEPYELSSVTSDVGCGMLCDKCFNLKPQDRYKGAIK